jgi:hypothetical protein
LDRGGVAVDGGEDWFRVESGAIGNLKSVVLGVKGMKPLARWRPSEIVLSIDGLDATFDFPNLQNISLSKATQNVCNIPPHVSGHGFPFVDTAHHMHFCHFVLWSTI